jgi:DNA-binding NarL/FixJ family response regulator
MSQARILVVDDHPIVSKGLADLIDAEPGLSVCGDAATMPQAISQIHDLQPSLLIVDLSLKDGSGLELVKQVKCSWPDMPVLVLSMHDEQLYAERALRAGALGYVMKHEDPEVLLGAIRQVLRGKVYLSQSMQDAMLNKLVPGRADASVSGVASLTDRELEVFQLLGQGISTKEIANQLKLSVKTIETHRAHLKSKLGVKNATQLIRFAVEWWQQQDKP